MALGEWGLSPLRGISTTPMLFPDGAIRTASGYDSLSRLWCANVPEIDLAACPRFEDAERALASLRAAFQSFPFADAPIVGTEPGTAPAIDRSRSPGQDESALLIGLLTAVCRASLPLSPGIAIVAPQLSGAGTGKGLLIRAISAIAFGVPPRAFTLGRNIAELELRLGAVLMEATPIVFLDNINSTSLRSDLLASVLSEPNVDVRVLGVSQMVRLNPSAFVAVTGNGLRLSEDLTRRFLLCELDAKTEDPEARPFAPGFINGIKLRRLELLSAALTIWRWGRQNEGALKRGRPLGSFELWSQWVRDPLLSLGCADPVERISKSKGHDPERARVAAIYLAWDQVHKERPIAAAKLAPSVTALIDPQGRGRQYVASAVAALAGTRATGFVLTRQDAPGTWGAATYALRSTGKGVDGDGDPVR